MSNMTKYTVAGTTDENTTCDCCGKSNLKMTVVLRDEDGEFHFFGRSCAARATGWKSAYLSREILSADSRANAAREALVRWSRYLTADGVDVAAYLRNNPHMDKYNVSHGEHAQQILGFIAKYRAEVESVRSA
jgi:hypothetical protein